MVVCPTHKNDERRSRKPHLMEAKVGGGTIVEMWWDKMASRWLAKRNGCRLRKKRNTPEEKVQASSHSFCIE